MSSERERVENELTAILNRALRSVPFVKLDAVDEVTTLFNSALQLMEENLEFEDSDSDERINGNGNFSKEQFSPSGDNPLEEEQDFTRRSAGNNQEAPRVGLPSFDKASLPLEPNELKKSLASKLICTTITKDYSSPSAAKRSLTGLKTSTPLRKEPKLGLGKQSPHPHKPSSRASAATVALPSEDEEGALRVARPLKHKLVSRAQAREFPSPKLGARSIGSTPSLTTRSTDSQDLSMNDEDSAELVEHAALDRVKQEVALPVTASPKQFKSSLMLLSLAKNAEMSQLEDDLNLMSQNGEKAVSVASTTVSGSSNASSSNITPRPVYLRRLDSPDSHHGQLLNAKARLQILINKMLQTVPNVKLEMAPQIREALLTAVEKLEASCVQQSYG